MMELLLPLRNNKFQAPNSKQIRKIKSKIQNHFEFAFLDLEFVWCLEFGIWNFSSMQ